MPRCDKLASLTQNQDTGVARELASACLVLLATAFSLSPVSAQQSQPAPDSRQVYSSAAPDWLRAVGKLQVPGSIFREGKRSHVKEDCSATLVTDRAGQGADTIITAWHCLANYNDLSKPIVFALTAGPNDSLQREAYRVADGGGMYADWAILRLKTPIAAAQVEALTLHPGRADPARTISMAGYSRDPGIGASGTRLSYDPACNITAAGTATSDSNCIAHKGASGGAVVQVSVAGAALFSGVISAGDSAGMSTFVPVGVFRAALGVHL